MKAKNESPKNNVPHAISLPLLAIALCLSLFVFYQQSANLRQIIMARQIRDRMIRISNDPSTIENWMTFDYIDHIFNLPAGYLKTALAIDDARYPRLTIRSYEKKKGIADGDFIIRVRAAVGGYKK